MKKTILSLSLIAILFTISAPAQLSKSAAARKSSQQNKSSRNSGSIDFAIKKLNEDIPRLMNEAEVPGMSVALIRNGKMVWSKGFGVKSTNTKEPVTTETVFEAASLSKPLFAYAVLKLVDAGKLNLDEPLYKYLGNTYKTTNETRLKLITARHVLTHTSGFPNWRGERSKAVPIYFEPGEKFGYSGEGFVYLSKVVEKITKTAFEDFVEKEVFKPLEMFNSSFVWRDEYKKLKAYNHDSIGEYIGRNEDIEANAAASLHTTAEDYAKFIIAVLNGNGLKSVTRKNMFVPQIKPDAESYPLVSWGLGFGLETNAEGKTFWHWGDNGNTKAFVMASEKYKNAVIFFANSTNGLSFIEEIVAGGIGGKHQGIAWLNYERYDSPTRRLLKAIDNEGAESALKKYRKERKLSKENLISEANMKRLGYLILRLKKIDDAIEVFKQNVTDFPLSADTWDSLAEAYLLRRDKDMAKRYYQKSLELNPKNKNAADRIKELEY